MGGGAGEGGRGEGAGRRGVSVVAAAAGGGRGNSRSRCAWWNPALVAALRLARRLLRARRELRARKASVALRPCSPARTQARERVAGVGEGWAAAVLSRNIDIRAGAEVDPALPPPTRALRAASRTAARDERLGGDARGTGRSCGGRSRATPGTDRLGGRGSNRRRERSGRDRKLGRRE